MKTTQVCPKCEFKQFWIIDEVRQPNHDSSNRVYAMPMTAYDGIRGRVEVGRFEAWVCAGCGYTEWYARFADEPLRTLANIPGTGVKWRDCTAPAGGAYR